MATATIPDTQTAETDATFVAYTPAELKCRDDMLRRAWKMVPQFNAGDYDAVADSSMYIRQLSNEELFAIGERALTDIIDNIVALHEIRLRFLDAKGPLMGYASWSAFVEKNSRYSARTIQRRMSEINGKDTSKINTRYSNREPRPSIVPVDSGPNDLPVLQHAKSTAPTSDYDRSMALFHAKKFLRQFKGPELKTERDRLFADVTTGKS